MKLTQSILIYLLACACFPVVVPSALAEATPSDHFHTTPTMRYETKRLVFYLERQHYLGKGLEDLDNAKLIVDYLHDFDVNRLYLYQADVDAFIERYETTLADYLEDGYLDPAFKMFLRFRERADERLQWIAQYLDSDIQFDVDMTYQPDRSEAEWPTSEAEANDLWERRIKFEILNEVLARLNRDDDTDTAAADDVADAKLQMQEAPATAAIDEQVASPEDKEELLAEARKEVTKRYKRLEKWIGEIDPTEVQEIFLTTLTHQYDPHSTYMSADTLEEFAIAMRNSLVGIGALLSDEDGYCTIKELLPGGPAEASRLLEAEDQIVGVAQGEDGEMVDVIGMKLNKVVKMIRGKKGSVVRLLIRPAAGDPSERRTISLIRDEIQLTAKLARAEVFEVPAGDRTLRIGVIELPAFYGSDNPHDDLPKTSKDVEELIVRLKEMKVEGIVLDLRGNGGGLLKEAIELTGLFIPVGPVVQVRDYIGHVQEFVDQDPKVAWEGPLMVLVSRFSASASEIAAGALKNHGRAIIVGDEETHGKGTVQAVFEMSSGSNFLTLLKPRRGAAKVTVQKYYLPDGSSTQIEGVKSDIVLPSVNEYLPIGESDLPNAMAWDTIDSLEWDKSLTSSSKSDFATISLALIESLRERSLERQNQLEEFTYLTDNIEWFRARQEQDAFSLRLDERQSKMEADVAFRDEMETRLRELAEDKFSSEEILLKVTEEQQAAHEAAIAQPTANQQATAIEAELSEDGAIRELDIAEVDDLPDFDIHLREGLRIMADWINQIEKNASSTSLAAAHAADTSS